MRQKYLGLSFIVGLAIILYFLVNLNSSQYLNSAYSETSKILNLSNEIINSTFPQIKTQNNTIYVIWNGDVGHGVDNEIQSDIFLAKSENKGNSFGEPINLSNDNGSSFNPQSEISSNNIYVVWEDDTLAAETSALNSNTSILFRQSKDNASTFSPIVSLSSINADSSNPDITTINGNTVYVVWQDDLDESSKILFKKSMSNENTLFSDQQIISDSQGSKFEISPEIITSNNTINIVWDDFNSEKESSHILKRSSIDGGITFGQIMQLSDDSEFAINEIVSVHNNNMYIVWQGNTKGQFDVFLSKSSDGGITFSQPINFSNDPSDSINPNLIVVHNNLFVIWNDNSTKNYNVMIKRSSDGGITFSQPINLSNTTNSDSINPQLAAIDNNKLFVVWQGNTNGQFDVFLSKSSDGGITFSQPIN
ncbi:MAG: sialidase family protein, partial [Nitrososphaeraceae archaeon]